MLPANKRYVLKRRGKQKTRIKWQCKTNIEFSSTNLEGEITLKRAVNSYTRLKDIENSLNASVLIHARNALTRKSDEQVVELKRLENIFKVPQEE